jgi:predicted MFS family arabinose efflux permease
MAAGNDRLFTPPFITLTLAELAYFTAGGLVIGVTPFFVTGPLGSDEAGLGLVAGAFGVATLLLRPYAGRLSDRRGRRPLLIGGAALFALVLFAHVLTSSLPLLIGLRLLLGVAEALFFVAGYAALADLAPPGRTGEALSYNSLALYLGIALGPALGQLLTDLGGYGAAWGGGGALCLLAAALALRMPETAVRQEPGAAAPQGLFHRAAVGPGLALFSGVAAMSGYLLLAGKHAESMGVDAWSVTFLVFGGVVVGLRALFAWLPDRMPPMRLGAASLAMIAAGLALVVLLPGYPGLLAGTVAVAAGVAFMTPALFSATFARVAPEERGMAAGTATVFIDLGFSGGPFAAGFVAAALGFPAAFAVSAAIALAGAIGTVAALRSGGLTSTA